MRLTGYLGLIALCIIMALGQIFTECTPDLLATDDCADVANPIACYNEYRWNTQTLQCIDGTNDADRRRKAR